MPEYQVVGRISDSMKRIVYANQQGQGLVESLIVMLFISISVVVLISFGHYLSYSTSLTQQQTDANTLAVNETENLRDFQVINNLTGYTSYQGIASGSGNATVGNTSYSLSWTVTANTSPTYKTIDVTVSWTDRFGVSQSVRLISNVAGVDPGAAGSFM